MPRAIAMFVAISLGNLICVSHGMAQAAAQARNDAKAKIATLGSGPKASVRITLRDGKKVQGWISEAADEQFAVINEKTGAVTTIAYDEVKDVKSLKPRKIAIAGAAVVVIGLAALIFFFAGAKH